MRECPRCFQDLNGTETVCPSCGKPLQSTINEKVLTVEEVKAQWRRDISQKVWKVQPSLDAMHKAEKMAMGMGMNPQISMNHQMGMRPQMGLGVGAPNMQQPFGMNPLDQNTQQRQASDTQKGRDLAALFKLMKQNQQAQ